MRKGKITQIIGAVVDVSFEGQKLPEIYNALELDNLLAVVDEPSCTHCKLCIPACPVHALTLTPTVNL